MHNRALHDWPTELYDAYIFDMDGTIYLGDQLLPGAQRMIEELRHQNRIVRFLSNNPTKDPEQYVEKLKKLGIEVDKSDIANTVVTTVGWLKHHYPEAVVFPIAEQPLINALHKAGIRISDDPTKIDIVIASYDRTFDYRKLQIAFDAIWFEKRAFLIATNPDRFCPFPGGRGEPDCAAIIAAIEACTGTTCREVIGKPNPIMLEEALGDTKAEKVIMVGDRLSTDIAMAGACQIDSAMPLTGESTVSDVEAVPEALRPTYVLDRVDRLIPQYLWEQHNWSEERDHTQN